MDLQLSKLQPFVVQRLTGYAPLNGAVVIANDGTFPKTPGREEGLASVGLVLTVWQIESLGSDEVVRDGALVTKVGLYVLIEENQQICRGTGGANVPYEDAIELVLMRLAGSGPGGCGGDNSITPQDQPFENFGKEQGINRAIVNFTKQLIILPDLSP